MRLYWTREAWEDYLYWQTHNKANVKRINALVQSIMRSPFEGLGKPEALKYGVAGYWSRRIDYEHRLVYRAQEDTLIIIQCRFHY